MGSLYQPFASCILKPPPSGKLIRHITLMSTQIADVRHTLQRTHRAAQVTVILARLGTVSKADARVIEKGLKKMAKIDAMITTLRKLARDPKKNAPAIRKLHRSSM